MQKLIIKGVVEVKISDKNVEIIFSDGQTGEILAEAEITKDLFPIQSVCSHIRKDAKFMTISS